MPKLVNVVTRLVNTPDLPQPYISATTFLASSPKLYWACEDPQDIPKLRPRQGEEVAHGLQKWFNNVHDGIPPDFCQDNLNIWLQKTPCKTGGPCWYFLAQPHPTPPAIDWSSPPIPCKPKDPAPEWCQGIMRFGSNYLTGVRFLNLIWQDFTFTPMLPGGGGTINLPNTGYFSSDWAVTVQYPIMPITVQTRLIDNRGTVYKTTDQSSASSMSCAANIGHVPKTAITHGGLSLSVQIQGEPVGSGFRPHPPSFWTVQWWPS